MCLGSNQIIGNNPLIWGIVMANFAELVEETKLALQDGGDIDEERVKLALNEAYKGIVEETEIPSLKKIAPVQTVVGQAWLNMPGGFSGKLRYVGDSAGKIQILDNGVEEMIEIYPGLVTTGNVRCVALQGNLLYYQGIPDVATDLIVLYYEDVNELEAGDDTPDYLPVYLHRELLVSKAAAIEYTRIEDGMEGIKVNTVKYTTAYEEAKQKLQEWIARRRRHSSRSIWDA
jgi:hypothetical protein